jgi:nicotinate-nucleotide pyrophosphorylase (carboxylating)
MSDFFRKQLKQFDFEAFIKSALKEDAGSGDHTSLSIIPADRKGKMRLLVKEDGVIAGVEAGKTLLKIVNPKIRLKILISDGAAVKKGDVVFVAEGPVRDLLLAERLLLNIMQRMSGIATKTAYLQGLCKGTKTTVTDTRKTTPGFRFFEKWAVQLGGGANHRYGLYDMILIKDNHIDFAGGITEAIDAANAYIRKHKLKIPVEVETRTLGDVRKVLAHGKVQRIMFDNFTPADTKKAVALVKGQFQTESSGGITEKNIRHYAAAGVDLISIGALTHHIKSLDLSFKAV